MEKCLISKNYNMKIDISETVGVVIKKVLEYKNVEPFTKDEFEIFLDGLKQDEDFLNSYKNCVNQDET